MDSDIVQILNILAKNLKEYSIASPKEIINRKDLNAFVPKEKQEDIYKYHNKSYFTAKKIILDFDKFFEDRILPEAKKVKILNKSQIDRFINSTEEYSKFSLKIKQDASQNFKIVTYLAIKNHIDISELVLNSVKKLSETLIERNMDSIDLHNYIDSISTENKEFVKLGFFVAVERILILGAMVADNLNDYKFLGSYYSLTLRFAKLANLMTSKMLVADV